MAKGWHGDSKGHREARIKSIEKDMKYSAKDYKNISSANKSASSKKESFSSMMKKANISWKKSSEKASEIVWINEGKNLRVVVGKGDKSWSVWYEKNIGRIGSDASYMSNAWIATLLDTRQEAVQKAKAWMEKN